MINPVKKREQRELRKKVREMKKEKDMLREQMKLLAEQSRDALDSDLAILSNAMCEVYKALVCPSGSTLIRAHFLIMCMHLIINFAIFVKKLFWSKTR